MANGTNGEDPTDPGGIPRRPPGSMSYQDPSTTRPRPPTLAEQKAREQAERRRQAAAAQEAEAAEKSRVKRKRILIGAGVTVGVVAVIAVNYGGSGDIGQRVSGGTTTVPKSSTRVSTSSGKTLSGGSSSGSSASDGSSSSVSRGGLGSSSGSSSSGS